MDLGLITALRCASRLVVFTGAGVSAESGIPTFRDKQTGLWENFDAAELATPHAFERDPAFVWGWYEWRRGLVLRSDPNPGHRAIAALQIRVPHFILITQNVDDLHERAGSRDVSHLHGELSKPYCEACRQPYEHAIGVAHLPLDGARLEPPRCLSCSARIRPGVVWFGESLPEASWKAAREAAKNCDFFICCGTSALVQPAASLVDMAMDAGATTLQINPNPTELDSFVTFALRGPSGMVLPRLVTDTWGAH
ncbi:MAG: SIR2 family NAD-dependent protein deacylase [Steroidobacteraceae bacterium]